MYECVGIYKWVCMSTYMYACEAEPARICICKYACVFQTDGNKKNRKLNEAGNEN